MRPLICPDVLRDLIDTRFGLDCQLELALFRAGITARTDLERLRVLLGHSSVGVRAGFDQCGRRQLCFVCGGTLIGVLHADGTIAHFTAISHPYTSTVGSQNINVVS